jgi:hypothetical protein
MSTFENKMEWQGFRPFEHSGRTHAVSTPIHLPCFRAEVHRVAGKGRNAWAKYPLE